MQPKLQPSPSQSKIERISQAEWLSHRNKVRTINSIEAVAPNQSQTHSLCIQSIPNQPTT